jgi:hypothetical protein
MGGSAFTDLNNPAASLLTPRMPTHVYLHVRDRSLRILRTLYAHAECPIEAPAKADYGDVDILVASPHNQANTNTTSLAAALGAIRYKSNSPTTNFALPWPTIEELNGDLQRASTNSDLGGRHDDSGSESAGTPQYIQLDLHVCPTPESFQWELFHQAHGDLWNILGGMIRPYGLVVNHIGLHLRLAGVDDIARDRRTIQLTTSPSAVLRFLDLDECSYWTPFDSVDAMFVYAASCRFYDPKAYRGKEDLKSNDRLRMKKRPMFTKWYEGYLQERKGDAPGSSAGADREEVIDEAKRVFGVGKEYDEKRAKGLRAMGLERLWSDIRKGLPIEGLRIGIVMRGVKREVVGKGLAQEVEVEEVSGKKEEVISSKMPRNDDEELSDVQRAYVDGIFDEVTEWTKADWEGIEQRQISYEREQSTKHLLAKIERDKAKKAELGTRGSEAGTETGGVSAFETAKMQEALRKE